MTTIDLLIDDQVFRRQDEGGISRYFAHLVAQFDRHPDIGVRARIPLRYTTNRPLLELTDRCRRFSVPARRRGLGRRVLSWSRPLAPATYLSENDMIHHTYYDPAVLRETPGATRIVTVYDMIPEMFPRYFPGGNPHGAKREYVRAADAVLCISEATKTEMERHFGPTKAPVHVVGLAADDSFFEPTGPFDPGFDYVLYVGSRDRYKGFDTLLSAFALVAGQRPGLQLFVVGSQPFSKQERELQAQLGVAGRVHIAHPSTSELASMYAGASACVFPSLAEGFGLPVLEALATGSRVLVSDIPAFQEVADEAAEYFPTLDHESLAALITAQSPVSEQTRRARARDFSWRRTAEKTAEVYREVARRASVV
ncbi:MAG: glycosyltransferase family 4 protein [Actinobacteria bacterium]|nr:glycosyltransferase family 4 protein [Actinomycetota bacterium]